VKTDQKLQDFRSLEVDELAVRLKQARRELYELRFRLAVGQLEDSSQILKTRKDIARILTVMRQRELGEPMAESQPEPPATEETPTGLSTAAGEAQIGEETESEETEEVSSEEDEEPEEEEGEEEEEQQ
jgi:large subunit ribosomal protein L29